MSKPAKRVRPFRLTAPQIPEDSLHKTVADILDRWLIEPAVWTHFPAGGYQLGVMAAARLKRLGLKAGMPDILCWYDHRCVGIELKRDTGGRSSSQRAMHPKLEAAGVTIYVCRSPEAVIDVLVREGFPIQIQIVKAMLMQPFQPADRPVKETSGDKVV